MQTTSKEFTIYIKRFWIVFLSGIGVIFMLFLLASWGAFGEMPDHTVLENPSTYLATEIISSDNKTLGKYYLKDNRIPVDYNQLPQHLVDALVATEDVRFYKHSGIDARATLRAIVKLGRDGGASTITQQLAKQLFHGTDTKGWKRYTQKIKEWIIAIRLERQYTKEEIIAMYFNIYDFNNNADGIRSAANIYFGKEPKELDLKESAMLVGMLKNSSLFNPRPNKRPEKTKKRRNVVLYQMEKYDYISKKIKDSVQKLDLGLNYTPQSHNEGTATYFRNYIKRFMNKWIKKNLKPDGTKYSLYNDGLKIYTTINSRMQTHAEDAVQAHMKNLQKEFFAQNTPKRNKTAPFLGLSKKQIDSLMSRSMRKSNRWKIMEKQGKSKKQIIESFYTPTAMSVFSWKTKNREIDTVMKPIDSIRYYKTFLHAGLMSMEPQTGHIKAWVGGIGYKHFQYDHVKQGKRQVGSTFKPFVYAAAIDQLHLSPCDTIPTNQMTIEEDKFGKHKAWTVKNSNEKYGGYVTYKKALANSINTVSARIMDKIGPRPVIKLTKGLGVKDNIPSLPSIALGTPDLSLYEMVAAYSTFANKGVYNKPIMITGIEDRNGTLLYQNDIETKDVLSEEVAYVIINLMEGVTQSGSGSRLRHTKARSKMYKNMITGYPYGFNNPIAGKTGTTQNQSDGWFIGIVPNLVTGVWVGAEDRATHFKDIIYGQGASMALPIWGVYMKSCYADDELEVSKSHFKRPKYLSIELDCNKVVSDIPDNIIDEEIPDF